MVRAILLIGFGIALGYGASVAHIGGKPVSHYAVALWRSKPLQHKLQVWRQQLPAAAHDLLAKSPTEVPRRTSGRPNDANTVDTDKLSERDRRELDALLDKARRSR